MKISKFHFIYCQSVILSLYEHESIDIKNFSINVACAYQGTHSAQKYTKVQM